MRKIVTVNKKIEFDSEICDVQKSNTKIIMNGLSTNVITTVRPVNSELCGYKMFEIIFHKKYKVDCIVNDKQLDSILRVYKIPILVSDQKKYVLSYSTIKGTIARAAFKRIRKDTKIKCTPIKIDLAQAYHHITSNIPNVTVYSGWFSKLGQQLKNALLQGNGVDNDDDWNKYNDTLGSELKNIQLEFEDDKYSKGSVIVSLSARGFIFTNSIINDHDFFEIVEKLINILDEKNIIKDANEEEEKDEIIVFNDN